jgi:hypothetical protein
MLSWNWYILKSYLTLMSPPYFYWSSISWRDHVHASLLLWLFSFINTLQNYIWPIGSFNCNHLKLKLIPYDHSRKWKFANFTFEFVEIISFYYSNNFFLNFAVNPLLQALNMNKSTISFTVAWWDQKVILLVILPKTNLTWSFFSLSCLKNSIELSQKYVLQNLFIFMFGQPPNFNYFKLNSAHFHDIARL